MKVSKLFICAAVVAAILSTKAHAAGGFKGHCIAYDNGKTYYIKNGDSGKKVCFKKARSYFSNSSTWTVNYNSNRVFIKGNFTLVRN